MVSYQQSHENLFFRHLLKEAHYKRLQLLYLKHF